MTEVSSEMLIQYYYNELNASDRAKVSKAIQENWTIKEKYDVIKTSANRLNKFATEATLHPKTINTILQYAHTSLKSV
jgi:hypothetical protein